jgi:hypothetical protein
MTQPLGENPVNPDADQIGQAYGAPPVETGGAGAGRRRLSAAYIAIAVAVLLALVALLLVLTDVI